MAGRRKGPRKQRQQGSSQTLPRAASVAAAILALCLCAFNFDSNGETTAHPRLETCRSTCDDRLQSAALESHVPSSSPPASADAHFLRRDANDPRPAFRGGVDRPPSPDGSAPSRQARPRRLPALIKVLTGFGDERPSNGGRDDGRKSVIAGADGPDFAPRVRRGRGDGPPSHEETVQMAAAAAAAAVFSKSIRIFGNNRMHRVNSEWDAALRWIAGWDQQQRDPSESDGGDEEPSPMRAGDGGSPDGGASQEEGYNTFVDDLAKMLESCIKQCVEDEQFEARLEKDGIGPGEVVMGGLSIGNTVLKSFFGWIGSHSLPRILRRIASDAVFILARTFQIVGSSLAIYGLHSLWGLASPALFQWYSLLGYTESPKWLLEHEKEIELAKTSRSRHKKKARRRQSAKQPGGKSKATTNIDAMQESSVDKKQETDRSVGRIGSSPDSVEVGGKVSGSSHTLLNESEQTSDSDRIESHPTAEITAPTSKDSLSVSQDSSDSVPSVISYSSTSASSSPSIKPIGNHLDRDIPCGAVLQAPPRPVPALALNSQLDRRRALPPHQTHTRSLRVPTQEQRNQAARQLREFQNAQIQRLLRQRKLSQTLNVGRISVAPPQSTGSILKSSFQSAGTASTVSGQRIRVLRPPPGLTHPSQNPYNPVEQNQEDKAFLNDNELFLSRLLDDDEDADVEVPSSLQIGIESMSPESSLDPSAAPFVSSGKVGGARPATCPFPKPKEANGDVWQSGTTGPLLKANSAVRITGVYGGSVW